MSHFSGIGKYDSHVNGNGCARYHQEASGPDYHLIEGSRCQVNFLSGSILLHPEIFCENKPQKCARFSPHCI